MAQHLQFDDQDKAALHALDNDFTISSDGETATVTGEMQVELIRLADGNRFKLTITFPNGEPLEVRIARAQLLQELGVEF